MGEGFGTYKMGNDAALMEYVSSVNIACGFHGGDPRIMRETVRLAIEKNVGIGAHPGLQDLIGFGRREMEISPQEVYDLTVYQIGALQAFITSEGGVMQHVKPHGALYNMAAKRSELAEAVAEAIYRVNPKLILFGLAGSSLILEGKKLGLSTAEEAFADRSYMKDGSLASRKEAKGVIKDAELAVKQAIQIVKEETVNSLEGDEIPLNAKTICLHGDGEHALTFARKMNEELSKNGVRISNFLQTRR